MTMLWKSGIYFLIPLPVPKAWESGTHRNSTGRLPLFKEGMNVRDVHQHSASISIICLLSCITDDRPERLHMANTLNID